MSGVAGKSGRTPMNEDDRKEYWLRFRVTAKEKEKIRTASEKLGTATMTELMKKALWDYIRRNVK